MRARELDDGPSNLSRPAFCPPSSQREHIQILRHIMGQPAFALEGFDVISPFFLISAALARERWYPFTFRRILMRWNV